MCRERGREIERERERERWKVCVKIVRGNVYVKR